MTRGAAAFVHDVNIANGHIYGVVNVDGWLGTSARYKDVLDELVMLALNTDGA